MRCQLLMSGHELMSGVTVDTNSTWIADQLLGIGIAVDKKVTVGDDLEALVREIELGTQEFDLLLLNGGLGPTVDDLTAEALGKACQKNLQLHPTAEQHVRAWCASRGISTNAANLKQAWLPEGADIIPNRVGSAVGIQLRIGRCLVLCTPGVPTEMKSMVLEEILPILQREFVIENRPLIRRLQVFGMGESSIQQKISAEIREWPDEVQLGFRAAFPTLEIKLIVYGSEHLAKRDQCESQLRQIVGGAVFGEENDTLASIVLQHLEARGDNVVTAESCTGGLIASTLTAVPGASKCFSAGFVTYSNEMKTELLGVRSETLREWGAVSEPVVLEMLAGALEKTKAKWGLAVSGVAGPDGGSQDKPVGTVWIAWGTPDKRKAVQIFYPAERKQVQLLACAYALDLLRRELTGIEEVPRYLRKSK